MRNFDALPWGEFFFVPQVMAGPDGDAPVAAASPADCAGGERLAAALKEKWLAMGGDGDPPEKKGDDPFPKKHDGLPPDVGDEDEPEEEDGSDTDYEIMPFRYRGKRLLGSSCLPFFEDK